MTARTMNAHHEAKGRTYFQRRKLPPAAKVWCAYCGQWTDHQSGKCPFLHEATYRVPVDKFKPMPIDRS